MSRTTFKDLRDRAWNLSINPDAARRIQSATSLNLFALRHGKSLSAKEFEVIGNFLRNTEKCWRAVVQILWPQIVDSGIDAADWSSATANEKIMYDAFVALGYAFAEFLPNGNLAPVLTAAHEAEKIRIANEIDVGNL